MEGDEGVDMRSNRLRYHKTRAKIFYQRGENSLKQKMLLNGFSLKFETAALYFYQSSISYRAASKWREAGDALCRAATLYHYRLKSAAEAASLYAEASECYEKVDNHDTIKCLVQSISLYCDLGQFVIAGKLQKYVADLHYSMKHYEEAYSGYRKASDFLSSLPNQSDICLEKSIHCLLENHEYQLASELYLILAESCNQTNLKSFQTKYHLFHSLLCQMAVQVSEPSDEEYENKYAAIRTNILSYESYDITWRCSKQALFLQNIIAAREAYDQHAFADHLYYYFTIYSFNNYEIVMLKVVSDEIVSELERRIEERKKELYEATKKQRRKAKLLKKRRQLRERGLNPFTIRIEDIEDDSSEEGNEDQEGEGKDGVNEDDDSLNSSKSSEESESESESSSSSGGASDIELPEELKEKPPPPRRRRGDPKPS